MGAVRLRRRREAVGSGKTRIVELLLVLGKRWSISPSETREGTSGAHRAFFLPFFVSLVSLLPFCFSLGFALLVYNLSSL